MRYSVKDTQVWKFLCPVSCLPPPINCDDCPSLASYLRNPLFIQGTRGEFAEQVSHFRAVRLIDQLDERLELVDGELSETLVEE